LSERQRGKLQDELVRTQVRAVATGSAFWRDRFAALGQLPGSIDSVAKLASVPAVGERDVSPTGDAAAMARIVLHGGERLFALHSSGPHLRRALRLRATRSKAYRHVVDTETKPTSYVWSGLGFRYPLALTRGDLDVVARAGARMWQVLGLTADDALLSALPTEPGVAHNALQLAALASGAPAVFPGDDVTAIAAMAKLAPPTVVALPSSTAPDVIGELAATGALGRVTTVLLVGAPTDEERVLASEALYDAGVSGAAVLGLHAPSGARVLWAECRESEGATGLHTYPDVDVVQVVDPDTADAVDRGPGELVLTQLGMRGTALLRWRTGDVVDGVDARPCPGCGRTAPRVVGTRRRALVITTDSGRSLDLRAVTGALSGRADLDDWRVVIGGRTRDGRGQVVVHLAARDDPGEAAVGAAADIRANAGMLPSQLVVATADEVAGISGTAITTRVLARG
jgi:phenylacetate-CoA ligase